MYYALPQKCRKFNFNAVPKPSFELFIILLCFFKNQSVTFWSVIIGRIILLKTCLINDEKIE